MEKHNIKMQNAMPQTQKWINVVLNILFFAGAILILWEIIIYRITLINWYIPAFIWLIIGVVGLKYVSNYQPNYYSNTNFFLQLVYSTVAFGGITITLLIGLNRYMNKDTVERKIVVEILKVGKLGGGKSRCSEQYAEVKIEGLDKQLIFSCEEDLSNSKKIEIGLKKGFLGFDVILYKKLIK